MARLVTNIALLLAVLLGGALFGGPGVLRLADEVASQVHSFVDWSDPESVTLARYQNALGGTLGPLSRMYEAAQGGDPAPPMAEVNAALDDAAALASEAAKDAPEDLSHLDPLFIDYIDEARALAEAWDTGQPPGALIAAAFDAQHALNDALDRAQDARLLRDLRSHEDTRGYAYHHRLMHYHGFRLVRRATYSAVEAGTLLSAIDGYRDAERTLARFIDGRSRVHDEFTLFVRATEELTRAVDDLAAEVGHPNSDDWIPVPAPGALINAFGVVRAQRQQLIRLERSGEI